MRAVVMVLRARFRQYWKSWLALTLLVAVTGGFVLATASAGHRPAEPTVLVNFGESVNFPLLFAVALSVFGAATLLHLLLVSVASRRVEAGLLKALGFVRRQVAAAVCWQATAVALTGIAALAAGVLAVANVLAAVPALLAARAHPARLLRAE